MGEIYVGLDPSLTGFGIAAVGAGVDRTWLLKPKKSGVDRLLEISYNLADVFTELGDVTDLALEDTVRSSYASSVLGELAGIVKMTCNTVLKGNARYPIKVPPSTLKKFATGRGNAKKTEVILSVYKHYGREFTDDNEADAYVLAQIAAGTAKTKYQQEVLEKLREGHFRDAHGL
jgi:crossover junction endodeoxyribonuclease RuvC